MRKNKQGAMYLTEDLSYISVQIKRFEIKTYLQYSKGDDYMHIQMQDVLKCICQKVGISVDQLQINILLKMLVSEQKKVSLSG